MKCTLYSYGRFSLVVVCALALSVATPARGEKISTDAVIQYVRDNGDEQLKQRCEKLYTEMQLLLEKFVQTPNDGDGFTKFSEKVTEFAQELKSLIRDTQGTTRKYLMALCQDVTKLATIFKTYGYNYLVLANQLKQAELAHLIPDRIKDQWDDATILAALQKRSRF